MNHDQKDRWGGLFEIPWISKVQRLMLDAGRLRGLSRALSGIAFSSIVDIGCGLGEASKIFSCRYVGVDNSLPRIRYASRRYVSRSFVLADAGSLPFDEK